MLLSCYTYLSPTSLFVECEFLDNRDFMQEMAHNLNNNLVIVDKRVWDALPKTEKCKDRKYVVVLKGNEELESSDHSIVDHTVRQSNSVHSLYKSIQDVYAKEKAVSGATVLVSYTLINMLSAYVNRCYVYYNKTGIFTVESLYGSLPINIVQYNESMSWTPNKNNVANEVVKVYDKKIRYCF